MYRHGIVRAVLARMHKGSRVVVEQMRVHDEVWSPQHMPVIAGGLASSANLKS
jgi:hypothetical protein